jgi:hypothetical protein
MTMAGMRKKAAGTLPPLPQRKLTPYEQGYRDGLTAPLPSQEVLDRVARQMAVWAERDAAKEDGDI